MNGKETSKDIIAEMRAKAECAKSHDDGVAMMLTDYADRFEAALRREKAAIEADALAVGGVVGAAHERELSKNMSKNGADFGQLGNAAKLRKALEELMKFTCNSCERRPCEDDAEEEDGQIVPSFCSAIIGARNVLADPPRNCDRFSTWEEANKAFEKANAHRIGFMNLYTDVLKWLFAPAKEGGANA